MSAEELIKQAINEIAYEYASDYIINGMVEHYFIEGNLRRIISFERLLYEEILVYMSGSNKMDKADIEHKLIEFDEEIKELQNKGTLPKGDN